MGVNDYVKNFALSKLRDKVLNELEHIKEKAKETLRDEIYWTVYRDYRPVEYGKRVLTNGVMESGRTWELLNSLEASDFSIEGGKLTFTIYLDASKMHHFSGRDPSKKVYIARWINYGHYHPTKATPYMYNTYPRRLFIESAMKRIKKEISEQLEGVVSVEVTKIGWKSR